MRSWFNEAIRSLCRLRRRGCIICR